MLEKLRVPPQHLFLAPLFSILVHHLSNLRHRLHRTPRSLYGVRIVPATTLHLVGRRIRPTRRAGDALRWLQHETDRRPTNDQPTDQSALIEALHDQIAYLRDQLAQERAANRENRRIIAAYHQDLMSELEAPSEPREEPETTTEDDGGEG